MADVVSLPAAVCDDCSGPVQVWFADNVFWNEIMGGPGTMGDPGGMLCIACFIIRAEKVVAPTAWHLTPEWPWRYQP